MTRKRGASPCALDMGISRLAALAALERVRGFSHCDKICIVVKRTNYFTRHRVTFSGRSRGNLLHQNCLKKNLQTQSGSPGKLGEGKVVGLPLIQESPGFSDRCKEGA
jgi:hypothetical protein